MKWQKTATLPTGAFPPAKVAALAAPWTWRPAPRDRKSTRLNSSHSQISYAVFCLKKKNKIQHFVDHFKREQPRKADGEHGTGSSVIFLRLQRRELAEVVPDCSVCPND